MNILAIESSCDETSAAVVKDGREVKSNIVYSQIEEHKKFGGVVPEVASRRHVEKISAVTYSAIKEASLSLKEIDAIAVTCAPGLIGALLVGVNFAKGIAYKNRLPLIGVHHIRSHVAANYISFKELEPPFISLIASGSHSHIVLVEDYAKYKILGRTRDDAAGEAFDKVARILGIGYPGGAGIDNLSKIGDINKIKFPQVSFEDNKYDFSFSGVKTAVINYVHKLQQKNEDMPKADIAASFCFAVTNVLCQKAIGAAIETKSKNIVLAGGVGANSMLRDMLLKETRKYDIKLFIPPIGLCTDNAAMVASQAYYEFLAGNIASLNLNGKSVLEIDF